MKYASMLFVFVFGSVASTQTVPAKTATIPISVPTTKDSSKKLVPPAIVLPIETNADRKPKLLTSGDLFIANARILTATHGTIERGSILVKGGKIVAIGNLKAPAGIPVFDATGKVVSPGIVDAHVHRGIDTTNEGTDAIVGEVRILDVLNADSKTLWQAAASGETSGLILHGSANPVGGQSQVIKFKFGHPVEDLPIATAPRMIKFALGENVTRSGNDNSNRFPHTRVGVEAVYRRAFTQAREYIKKWDTYEAKPKTDKAVEPPQRDLRLETLADILRGKIWVQCHSYRADEILMLVRLSEEFGFKIGAMQHALESYKIAPELAKAGVGVSLFADDWAGKLELYDAIPYAPSVLRKGGVNVSVNTDGVSGTSAIILDAAVSMRYGGMTEEQALDLVTINPARELGIDKRTGSIEVGKDADLVIWDGHPLSVYSKVDTTIIEGEVIFHRRDAFGIDKLTAKRPVKMKLEPFHYIPHPISLPDAKTYAIVGATVYPVSGPAIPNGTVLVENGRVRAVGVHLDIPNGAVKVDAHGLNVYPGFIDVGTTLGLTEFGQVGQATDARELGTNEPDLVAVTAVQTQSEHIPTTRCVGVTTVMTQPRGGSICGQGSVLDLQGWTTEQLAIKPKAVLCVNWPGSSSVFDELEDDGFVDNGDMDDGDGDSNMGGGAQGFGGGGGSSGDIASYFDKAVKYGRHHDESDVSLAAMQPYLTGALPVFIRVRDRAAIVAVVDFIKKYKLKGVLVGAPDAWKEAKLLADNKIPVVLTVAGKTALSANNPVNDWDPYDTPYACAGLLKRAGVKFCFQSDSYSEIKDLPQRAAESCAYGLSRDDMVRALTLSSAEILGMSNEIGSLEPGKRANIVISEGDPFEFASGIRYVFIDGKPVELTSKFTRLRDQYMKRVGGTTGKP